MTTNTQFTHYVSEKVKIKVSHEIQKGNITFKIRYHMSKKSYFSKKTGVTIKTDFRFQNDAQDKILKTWGVLEMCQVIGSSKKEMCHVAKRSVPLNGQGNWHRKLGISS